MDPADRETNEQPYLDQNAAVPVLGTLTGRAENLKRNGPVLKLWTLKRDHEQHCICLTIKKKKDGTFKIDGLTTQGWASNFWSDRENNGSPSNLLFKVLKKAVRENPPLEDDELELLVEADSTQDSPENSQDIPLGHQSFVLPSISTLDSSETDQDNPVRQSIMSTSISKSSMTGQDRQSTMSPSMSIPTPDSEVNLKDLTAINTMEVVAAYTDSIEDPFWLFLVEKHVLNLPEHMLSKEPLSKKQKVTNTHGYLLGYWFEKTQIEGQYQCSPPRTNTGTQTLVRFGENLNNIYVLPKHKVCDQFYILPNLLKETLIREISRRV
ncbi:uncharacterized protein [Clytia hemisphaerica]|uniref:uncharacterized protein isoform X2 n=1 Tax=Clytia hemisphaerica TaxID=252671 RepID=UPI0034D3B522